MVRPLFFLPQAATVTVTMPQKQKASSTLRRVVIVVRQLQDAVTNQPRLHVKDIQMRYGWSPRTVYRMIKRGKLPKPIRFTGSLWRLEDLRQAELAGQLPRRN